MITHAFGIAFGVLAIVDLFMGGTLHIQYLIVALLFGISAQLEQGKQAS